MASDFDKYLRYKRPEGFKFEFPADKKFVWIQGKGPEKNFVAAEVLETLPSGQFKIRAKDSSEERTIDEKDAEGVNPAKFDGVEDCALLGYLSQPSVLHNLRLRYDANVIYTYSGLFLVSVNPYRWFPIYTEEVIKRYKNKRRTEVPPHVYALADEAYRNVLKDNKSQSMLVTGESGAGKTENTKKIIQYLASIGGRSGAEGQLEKQLLQANPLLEALGNAKTLKNNNSSRFGKFIKITFDSTGYISGSEIVSYLLEKSRVVARGKGERSFHIFYQLFNGIPADLRTSYNLSTDPSEYAYLKQSECYTVAGIEDDKEYKSTMFAMETLGFSTSERELIYRISAGILHFGNVKFGGDEQAHVIDDKPLRDAAQLWKVNPESLKQALISPKITVGRERIAKGMTPWQADRSRDALTKALYGRMFLWIVQKINDSLKVKPKDHFIGILDIAGFEIFEHNSFEQLCINFTNERLQQFFNNHMFHLEQEEYKRENIQWTFINFGVDSQATIDLIQKKPRGILIILDEECVFPKATDKTFVEKLIKTHEGRNPKFRFNNLGSDTSFGIDHYAGSVSYDATLWLEKNKDPLQDDLETTIRNSTDPLLVNFFTAFSVNRTKGATFTTVGSFYREQLEDLMSTLTATYPHFVRCIIPNHKQIPGVIDDHIVLDQLACNGVLEGIRISRLGFPNRMIYAEFLKRYYLLNQQVPKSAPDAKDAVKKIIQKLISDGIVTEDNIRYGITKIFFRAGEMAKVEETREKVVGAMIDVIQACARGFVSRKVYERIRSQKKAGILIAKAISAWIQLRADPWWEMMKKMKSVQYQRIAQREAIEKQVRDKIAKIEAEKAAVLEQTAQAQASLDKLVAQQNQVEVEIDDARKRVQRKQAEIDEAMAGIRELDAEEANKLKHFRDQERQQAALKLEEQDVHTKIREIETVNRGVEDEGRRISDFVAKQRVEIDKIEKLVAEQKAVVKAQEEEKKRYEQDFEMRTDDVHDLIERRGQVFKEKTTVDHNFTLAQQDKAQKKADNLSLTTKEAELEDELRKLREQVDSSKKNVKDATTKTAQLQAANQNLSLKIDNDRSVGSRLQKENQAFTSDVKIKQENIDSERKVIRDLTEKIKVNTATLASKQVDVEQTTQEKEKLSSEITTATNSQSQRQKEVDLAKEKILKLSAEIHQLNIEVQNYTETNEELAVKISKAQKTLAQLNTSREELHNKVKAITDESEKTDKSKAKLETNIKNLHSDLQQQRQNKEKTNQHQQQLTSTKQKLLEELASVKNEYQEVFKNNNQQKVVLLETENSLSMETSQGNVSAKRVQGTEQHIRQLQTQREDLEREANNLTSFKSKLAALKDEFLVKLEGLKQTQGTWQQKVTQSQSRVDQMAQSLQNLDKENSGLDKSITKLESEEKLKREDLRDMLDELELAKRSQDGLELEIKDYQEEINDLEFQIHEVTGKIRANNQLLEEKRDAIDHLAQVVSELESKENAQLSAKVAALKEELSREQKKKLQLRERESQVEELIQLRKTELSEAESTALLDQTKAVYDQKIREEQEKLDEEQKQTEKIVSEGRDLKRELETIKRNIASAKEDAFSTEKDRESKLARLTSIRKELEDATNVKNKLEYKVSAAEKKLRAENTRQQVNNRQYKYVGGKSEGKPEEKHEHEHEHKHEEKHEHDHEHKHDDEHKHEHEHEHGKDEAHETKKEPSEDHGSEHEHQKPEGAEHHVTETSAEHAEKPKDGAPEGTHEHKPEEGEHAQQPHAHEEEHKQKKEQPKEKEQHRVSKLDLSVDQQLALAKEDIRKFTNEFKNQARAKQYYLSQVSSLESQIEILHDSIRGILTSKTHAVGYQATLKEEIDLLKGGIEADQELKPTLELAIANEQDTLIAQLKKRISEEKAHVRKLDTSCKDLRSQVLAMKVEYEHDAHLSTEMKQAANKANTRVHLAETDVILRGTTRNQDSPVHLPTSMNISDTATTIRRDTLRALKVIKKLQKYLENVVADKDAQDTLTHRLKDQVIALRDELNNVHLARVAAEKERETSRRLLQGQESYAQDVQYDHDKRKKEVLLLLQDVNNMRTKASDYSDENSRFEHSKDKHAKTIHELEMQLDTAIQRNAALRDETEQLESSRKRNKKELLDETTYRQEAESSSAKVFEELHKGQSTLREKHSQEAAIEKERLELEDEWKSLKLEIHRLERREDVSQEVTAFEKQIESYKDHIAREKERTNKIRLDIREREAEADSLKFDTKTLRYDLSVVKADIRKQKKAQNHLTSLIDHFKGDDEYEYDEVRA